MKTRDDFIVLAEAYRLELRRRAFILLPIMVIAIIACVLLAGALGRLLGNHPVVIGIWIVIFFLVMLGLNFCQVKSQQSLARKCGLVCPQCSRVFQARDLKLVIATHNCPYCGSRVYS